MRLDEAVRILNEAVATDIEFGTPVDLERLRFQLSDAIRCLDALIGALDPDVKGTLL